MDAFAVCVAVSASGQASGWRASFRLSSHFGLFQFVMPVLGWSAGMSLARLIATADHWIAFVLLVIVGGRMIWAGCHPNGETQLGDPSRGYRLVMLSIATSIDALAVGLSLAMLGVSIWFPSVVIGLVAFTLSLIGFHAGNKLSSRLGQYTEIAGGVILNLVGLRILISHLR